MRIIYMGSPASAIHPLAYLLDQEESLGYKVVAVVSQAPKLSGRGRQKEPTDPPVASFSKAAGLLTLQPPKASSEDFLAQLQALAPDVIVTCAYGQILTNAFLQIPRRATINIHPSLLPKFRGATPVPATLLAQEDTTGVTVLFTVRALDAGAIIVQSKSPIAPLETAGELTERLLGASGPLLLEALTCLKDPLFKGTPQEETAVTHCGKIHKEEGRIAWSLPCRELMYRFRAFAPWPGSYTFLDGRRVVVESLTPVESPLPEEAPPMASSHLPGSFYFSKPRQALMVKAGDGWLAISHLKPAGSRSLPAASFVNGLRTKEGLSFASTAPSP